MTSLDHLNLTVRDFQEAASWYRELFGFEIVETGEGEDQRPWGVLRSADSMLCIFEDETRQVLSENDPAGESVHRIYHFGLRIRDRERWEAMLTQRRIMTYYASPVGYPHSTSWYIKDPTGYIIEVVIWDRDTVEFGKAKRQ